MSPPPQSSAFECTSAHLERPREGDLFYKVQRALREKARQPYASPSTALTISTTSIETAAELDQDALTRAAAATPYGSIMTFTTLFSDDQDPPEVVPGYRRNDAEHITHELRSVLDVLWPRGNLEVTHYLVPGSPIASYAARCAITTPRTAREQPLCQRGLTEDHQPDPEEPRHCRLQQGRRDLRRPIVFYS